MIYILGAGGFAREVLNMYLDLNREEEVIGFLDKEDNIKVNELNNKPVFNENILNDVDKTDTKLICAIGSTKRKNLINSLERQGFSFDTIVHPSLISSKFLKIGTGCIICAGNIFTTQIEIDRHTIVNLSCTIGHDVNIGKYVTISPGVNISGHVTIEDECFIGTGASIIENITIGEGSVIGAGACVTKDVLPNTLSVGVPAKQIKELK